MLVLKHKGDYFSAALNRLQGKLKLTVKCPKIGSRAVKAHCEVS